MQFRFERQSDNRRTKKTHGHDDKQRLLRHSRSEEDGHAGGDPQGLPQAGAQISPRREPGRQEGRGEVQGDLRGQRYSERREEAQGV